MIPWLTGRYQKSESDQVRSKIEEYMRFVVCHACHGQRLRPEALAVKIAGKSIVDFTHQSVKEAHELVTHFTLQGSDAKIAAPILKEIADRLYFLINVGLGYLALDRSAATLSGGEAQRIRLATQIGSQLSGVLYVLDEPSIGLHPRDNTRLIGTLKHLRDL